MGGVESADIPSLSDGQWEIGQISGFGGYTPQKGSPVVDYVVYSNK